MLVLLREGPNRKGRCKMIKDIATKRVGLDGEYKIVKTIGNSIVIVQARGTIFALEKTLFEECIKNLEKK